MGTTRYDEDVLAWAREQAQLLRSGRYAELDIEHLAGEIEDVGKSEQRELESRRSKLRRDLYARQDEVDEQRNEIISQLEAQLQQRVEEKILFTIEWELT